MTFTFAARVKLAILLVLGVIVLGLRMVLPVEKSLYVVTYWGYWMILVVGIWYVSELLRYIRGKVSRRQLSAHWVGLLISAVGTLFIQAHEPRQFKILNDEFIFSGVARNMHFMREASFPLKAHNISDELTVIETTIDKRSIFFPLVLSWVHDLTGYRPGNVFILNAAATFVLLFLTYYFGYLYGGWRLGLACVLLWLGLPLFAQSATSGGYDVFNLTMLMLTWFFGRRYLYAGDSTSQSLFILTAICFAQVRFESILFVIPMVVVILIRWLRNKECNVSFVLTAFPILLLLPLLLNRVFVATPNFMQTDAGQAYFSLQYFPENAAKAIWYLFNFDYRMSNALVLSSIGVISTAFFLVRIRSKWRHLLWFGDDAFLLLIGLFIFSNFTLILCNFWGQLDDAAASRFSLPLYLFFILCFAWVVKEWRRDRPFPSLLFYVCIAGIVFAVPSAAKNSSTRLMLPGREQAWLLERLKEPKHRGALVLGSGTVGPIIYGFPAVTITDAEKSKWKVAECIKNKMYPEILVLEKWAISYKTGEYIPYSDDRSLDIKKGTRVGEMSTALSSSFKKETVAEIRLRPSLVCRLSRVIAVEGPDAVPPESYLKEQPPFENIAAHHAHIYSMLP